MMIEKGIIQIILGLLLCNIACAQATFDCNGRMFRVIEAQGGSLFEEMSFNETTGEIQFEELGSYFGTRINGIAYHPSQNLIYGVVLGKTYKLCRISADYQLQELVELPLPEEMLFVSGDVSPDERYLVLLGFSPEEPINLLALIDLTSGNFETQIFPLKTTSRKNTSIHCADIAFHPTNNKLYGFDHLSGRLVTINLLSRTIDNSSYPISEVLAGNVPTLFFDAFGNLFGIGSPYKGYSTNRRLYRFDLQNGYITDLERLSFEGNQDGCSCPFKVKLLNRVSKRNAAPCTLLDFNFTVINRTDIEQTNVSFRDTFPSYCKITAINKIPYNGIVKRGIGENILAIDEMIIPVGVDSFKVTVEIAPETNQQIVNNRAFLSNILLTSKTQTELILSDDPETAIPNDPTKFEIDELSVDFSNDPTSFCLGDTVIISPDISGEATFLWNTNETNPSIQVTQAGNYSVTVTTSCDQVSGEIQLTVDDIQLELGNDFNIESGESITITPTLASKSNVVLHYWKESEVGTLDCFTCKSVVAQPTSDVNYLLQVENESGCQATDELQVNVSAFQLFQPNAFSPNGRGGNEVFYLAGRHRYEMPLFQIFDRWGNLVFQIRDGFTNDEAFGWNGSILKAYAPNQVYVWYAEIVPKSGELQQLSGEINLLR